MILLPRKVSISVPWFLPAILALFLASSSAVTGCGAATTQETTATTPGAGLANNIGLMIAATGMSAQQRVNLAKSFGAVYYRPFDVNLQAWNGPVEEQSAPAQAGLKVILTVRNNGAAPSAPAAPPLDLDAYRRKLGDILDACKPEAIAVENEEDSSQFYTGTPEQYGQELKTAAEMVHASGAKLTNGGISYDLLAALVWNDYAEKGQAEEAESFAERSMTEEQYARLQTPQGKATIDRGKTLLNVYRDSGIDYVNFHWYNAEPVALGEAVSFLKRQTGLQPMTNEIGQRDESPEYIDLLLDEARGMGLPFIVWYSIDSAGTRSLVNDDGSLRVNGMAFRDYMREKFPAGS